MEGKRIISQFAGVGSPPNRLLLPFCGLTTRSGNIASCSIRSVQSNVSAGDPECHVVLMKPEALLLIATILLSGCDAISRTEIDVHPGLPGRSQTSKREIIGVASETAARFGLNEVERRDTDVTFTDALASPGKNPEICMTVIHSPDLIVIEISEMYIAHPTDKHKQLAQSLVQNLNAGGYNATILHQTSDARSWSWLFGAAVLFIAGFSFWIRFRERRLR